MLIIRLKKILFGYKASSDSYVNFLKKQGVTVGNKIEIFFQEKHLLIISILIYYQLGQMYQ